MARIGLAFGGAVAGFLLGGPLGAQIGFAIGGILGSVLFPGKLPPGPRVNDLVVTTATNGAAIPFGYGQSRIAGNVIWAPPIVEHSKNKSAKGGPKQTTYSYTASFAVAFGEGQGGGVGVPPAVLDKEVSAIGLGTSASVSGMPAVGSEIAIMFPRSPNSVMAWPGSPWLNMGNASPGTSDAGNVYISARSDASVVTATQAVSGGDGPSGSDIWDQALLLFGSTGITPTWLLFTGGNIFGGAFPADAALNPFTGVVGDAAFIFMAPSGSASFFSGPCTYNVTDDQGNNWVKVADVFKTGNPSGGHAWSQQLVIFCCFNTKAGVTHPTVHWTGRSGSNDTPGVNLFCYTVHGLGSIIFPSAVGRIWFDSKIVYDPTSGTAAITAISEVGNVVTVTSTLNPPIAAQVTIAGTTNYNGKIKVLLSSPVNFTYYKATSGLGPESSGTCTLAPVKYPKPTIYSGGEDQQADPTIQAAQGAATTPAYRGLIYAVWANFPLADFGNRIPTVRAEITFTSSTPQLTDIISDICARCGLLASDIDVSKIATLAGVGGTNNLGPGYVIGRPTTGQNALKPLALAFFFDGVESGGVVRFIPRGLANATLTIPESDLGLEKDKFKLTEQIGMAQDLPREFQVLFNDKALDYQQNKQHKRRHTRIVHTKQETVIELPMTIDSTTARQIAEKSLFLAYLERKPFDTNLWKSLYLLYDPTDVIQFVYEGLTFQMRIVKLTIGVDFSVAISGVNEDANNYLSSVVGSSGIGFVPAINRTLPDTILFLLDVPLLRDQDAPASGSGYYFAMSAISPATWPGASLQKSSDNVNFAEESTSATAANYGTASNILGPPRSIWTWDMVNTLTVFMINGTLAGTSDINVLNGANALLYGSEVIQYANAVQNVDGSFTISRLLRGRRGTDTFCGTHGATETVIDLINPGVVRQQTSLANLQVLRYFRPVTFGADISTIASQLFTDTGSDLFPYAPASLAGSRDVSRNLTLSWIRRTRIGGDWLQGIGTVPLSEATESYDVEVLLNGAVVRTFAALSSPTVVYTVANQITDFGFSPPTVTFNVYQNSGVIGRGFKATATV